jgi:hypothetical protein
VTALKMMVYSWFAILSIAVILFVSSQDWNMIRTVSRASRLAAGIFILMVILWGIAEQGWGGGSESQK